MHLVAIGVNHRSAPVNFRETLAIAEQNLGAAVAELAAFPHVEECCVVSTCNRTELYTVTKMRSDDAVLVRFLSERGGISKTDLDPLLCRWVGHHVAEHLFEVACGLDSMAMGETQILGQIKIAFARAEEAGTLGQVLGRLFRQAIEVGKRVRTETRISTGAFSIGAAAAQLARLVLANLAGRKALLLGAGEMGKLAAVHLKSEGIEHVFLANRTRSKAETVARKLGAEVIEFSRFPEVLETADVVISSTASSRPVITKRLIQRVMPKRNHTPLFVIDIAVPRDVDPEVADVPGVFVYNIDDLQFILDRCRCDREAEVERVREIIDEETAAFMTFLRTLEAVPLIKLLRQKFESVYEAEWRRCAKKLSHLSEEDRECVRRSIKSTVNRLTHDPILRLKDYTANGGAHKLDIAKDIFGLDHP